MTSRTKTSTRKKGRARPRKTSKPARAGIRGTRWSAAVMQKSDAMDLEPGVFKLRTARQVANSLKRAAEASHRRKSAPFRSAMSMLNFEINRGGRNLSHERVEVLNQAKEELRKLFGRPTSTRAKTSRKRNQVMT